MKTVEMLSFCPHLCPTLTDEQRAFYMAKAKLILVDKDYWSKELVVDKGHCVVVKVPAQFEEDATVIPLLPEMMDSLVHQYEERPIEETDEYPIPTRHLPLQVAQDSGWALKAGYVHVILYTKAQLKTEGMEIESDYGMVTLNVELTLTETPAPAHSMVRNSDRKYGGNGEWTFNHDEIAASHRHWCKHIRIK